MLFPHIHCLKTDLYIIEHIFLFIRAVERKALIGKLILDQILQMIETFAVVAVKAKWIARVIINATIYSAVPPLPEISSYLNKLLSVLLKRVSVKCLCPFLGSSGLYGHRQCVYAKKHTFSSCFSVVDR